MFQYSLTEAAALLGRSRSTVYKRYADSIDHLAQLFLEAGMLKENRLDRRLRRFVPDDGAELPPKKPPLSAAAAGLALEAQRFVDLPRGL